MNHYHWKDQKYPSLDSFQIYNRVLAVFWGNHLSENVCLVVIPIKWASFEQLLPIGRQLEGPVVGSSWVTWYSTRQPNPIDYINPPSCVGISNLIKFWVWFWLCAGLVCEVKHATQPANQPNIDLALPDLLLLQLTNPNHFQSDKYMGSI